MRDSSTRFPAVSVCAMVLGMALPSGLAYDLDPSMQAHNHACIIWADAATVGNNDAARAIEVAPGRRLCRAPRAGRGPTSELAPVLDAELNSLCRGTHDYEVATRPADANVFWHRQNFNALPLPLMTWLGAARPGVIPEGICRVNATGGSGNGWRLGVLYGAGRDYAKCQLDDGELIEGNYDLVGAYNRSAPYLPVLGPNGAARPRNDSLARIRELLDRHITLEDSAVFESITGTSLRQLRHALMGAPNVTVDRFLSADRWLHSELNAQGLHMLRCTLAERAVNERRRALGVTAHPDYADFMRDGFLIKDFSRFDSNDQLEILLSMVSGYAREDLPRLDWTLRSVTAQVDDKNTDLHVDSCMPSWKIWLYAEDIDESKGPLTYVPGSHHNSKEKLAWLYKASTDPPSFGAGSYGSFRMGQYGNAWKQQMQREASSNSTSSKNPLRPAYVEDEDGVWRCGNCLDEDERDFGMAPRRQLVGPKLSLVIADVSGLHARGLSVPRTVRRTFILAGDDNDGGIKRSNPFVYGSPTVGWEHAEY